MVKITCKTRSNQTLDFFLVDNRKEYYLFTQKRYRVVEEYFKNGVTLDEAIRHGKVKNNCRLHKVKSKLPVYIKYLESESGMAFLDQTKRRSERAA